MSDSSGPLPPIRARGPDFVGVGIQKSGTTWVGWILEQPPEVLMRKKEISFFVRYFHRGWNWYESWFEDKGQRRANVARVCGQRLGKQADRLIPFSLCQIQPGQIIVRYQPFRLKPDRLFKGVFGCLKLFSRRIHPAQQVIIIGNFRGCLDPVFAK